MNRQKRLKRGQAVRVAWYDSAHTLGWDADENPGVIGRVVSLGFVTGNHQKYLTISTSINTEAQCIAPLTIPWGAIDTLDRLGSEHDRNPKVARRKQKK